MSPDKIAMIQALSPLIAVVVSIPFVGWVVTTWLRIKNGYPLDGAWGQAIYPKADGETIERVRLLTQENAQLRAELGAVKDRLVVVERIVTDAPLRLANDIETLRDRAN